MIEIILAAACSILALFALALQCIYSSVAAHELKRLAGRGDQLARVLHRPVAYGANLRLLLWMITALSLAGGLTLFAMALPVWGTFIAAAVLLGLAFVVVPSIKLTSHSATFAGWAAPVLAWLLAKLHSVLTPLATFARNHRDLIPHSRLYEKPDLLALLRQQKDQPDNRITPEDLDLAHRALAFDDRHAADIAMPRSQTHLVEADDMLGPILLDQLFKSEQNMYLVYKDTRENIIGSLSLKDAIAAKAGGRVMDLVKADLCFVHEDFSLKQVMTALQATMQPLAVVINGFEELVGVITLDQLLSELLGEAADPGFAYDNRAAIAAYQPSKETAKPVATDDVSEAPSQEESSPDAPEVVE